MSPGPGCSSEDTSPLARPSYFKSPVNTLLASLGGSEVADVSVHDLIDAYSTFSLRIQAARYPLSREYASHPSLKYVKNNCVAIARCLQRDIRRALVDPLARDFSSMAPQTLASIPHPSFHISEESASVAKNIAVLCQQALQLVSNICYFQALYSLFPESILLRVIADILVISRSSELPTVDSDKTRSVAMWTFATLRLPTGIVHTIKDNILPWLEELTASVDCQPRACEIVHNMLSRYPHTFFEGCAGLLPNVLGHLASTIATARVNASVALAGYALSFLSIPPAERDVTIIDVYSAVHAFIRAQLPPTKPVPRNNAPVLVSDYLTRAAAEDLSRTDGQGPRWAITVICCLTVLSGHGIFTGTRPFKLIVSILELLSKRKGETATHLMACVWRCLVWAFLQLPRKPEPARPFRDDARPPRNRREAAFGLVRQELRGGVGACLVAGLVANASLSDEHASPAVSTVDLEWALSVLHDMVVHSSERVYEDSLAILGRLVSGIGKPTESSEGPTIEKRWNPNDIIVQELLSRHVLRADAQQFSAALKPAMVFDAFMIVGQWDQLVGIWVNAAERELRGQTAAAFALRDVLIQTWQALLLVQTQLTQEHGHLTATPDFAAKAVAIVAHFLERGQQPVGGPPSACTTEVQSRVLSLCGQLWTTMRHVFSESWLSAAAESLLTAVLKHTFDLRDDRVKASWSQLCSSLVSVSAPMLMARLVVEDEAHGVVDIKRELWRLAAKQWSTGTPKPSWQESVEFAATALRYWVMDDEETGLWTATIDNALAQAALDSEGPWSVLESLVQRIPEDVPVMCRLLDVPAVGQHLLSCLRVTTDMKLPVTLLRYINTFLCDLYSSLPERISRGLQALGSIRRAIRESSAEHTVDLLAVLSEGLAIWVGDKEELLLDGEYNDVIIPLYRDVLDNLRQVKITPDILAAFARLLYSVFIRIPAPGHGPIAFCEFWLDVGPSLKNMRDSYPEEIKIALTACRDVLGGASLQDISLDSDSHSGSQPEVSPMKSDSLTPQSASAMRARILELQKTPTPLRQRNVSPSVSPEVPFERGTSARRLVYEPLSTPSKRTNDHLTSSDFMPSSPTDAVRARRLAMRPTSRVAHERAAKPAERPLKRRKVDSSPRTPKERPLAESPSTPSTSSRRSTRNRPLVESPEIAAEKGSAQIANRNDSSTPRGAGTSKGKQVASTPGRPSPTKFAPTVTPSSDDYDAWEAPILDEDVPRLSDHEDIVPDSQPSDAEGEDESLLPSYMKTTGLGRRQDDSDYAAGRSGTSLPHIHAAYPAHLSDPVPCFGYVPEDDTMIVDDDRQAPSPIPTTKTQGKKRSRAAHPSSPVRVHTAPASLQHSQSSAQVPVPLPEEAGHPLRRARTASARLEELRHVYDALREEGSQLPVGEIAAASELAGRLGAMLSEKLSRRLRADDGGGDGGGGRGGEGSSKDKGKGRG
ncbi:hypothetical protein OH77DRAFT_1499498 [Trametes cingulata]|nr:hypothetical protein OH77DRAFT_1499498 [Trametes cingulata]